jgi:hypothetical protein
LGARWRHSDHSGVSAVYLETPMSKQNPRRNRKPKFTVISHGGLSDRAYQLLARIALRQVTEERAERKKTQANNNHQPPAV